MIELTGFFPAPEQRKAAALAQSIRTQILSAPDHQVYRIPLPGVSDEDIDTVIAQLDVDGYTAERRMGGGGWFIPLGLYLEVVPR